MSINKYLLASASTVALAGSASAADLALKGPPPVAPSWTGFYIGLNGGVVSHQSTIKDLNDWTDAGYVPNTTQKSIGALGGGQVGFNLQDDAFVWGLEADMDWASARANDTYTFCVLNCPTPGSAILQSRLNWLATVRARAGIAVGSLQNTLLYVTGGAAFAGIRNNWGAGYAALGTANPNQFVSSGTKVGWTAGVGIEHMFAAAPHWSVKAEALWIDFANTTASNPGPSTINGAGPPGTTQFNSQFQNQVMVGRVGVNYRF